MRRYDWYIAAEYAQNIYHHHVRHDDRLVARFLRNRDGIRADLIWSKRLQRHVLVFAGRQDAIDTQAALHVGITSWLRARRRILHTLQHFCGDSANDAPVLFVGHSMGGGFAQAAAVEWLNSPLWPATRLADRSAQLITFNATGASEALTKAALINDTTRYPTDTVHLFRQNDFVSRIGTHTPGLCLMARNNNKTIDHPRLAHNMQRFQLDLANMELTLSREKPERLNLDLFLHNEELPADPFYIDHRGSGTQAYLSLTKALLQRARPLERRGHVNRLVQGWFAACAKSANNWPHFLLYQALAQTDYENMAQHPLVHKFLAWQPVRQWHQNDR